jgi:hypothetical protein
VTPVEKVIELLSDLKAEVEGDGKEEAATYNEFACFCKSKTGSISDSILKGQDSIEELSATIQVTDSTMTEKDDELTKKKSKEGEVSADLESTTATCAKELADYEAADADVTAALESLVQAIDSLENSKPAAGGAFSQVAARKANAGLIAVNTEVVDAVQDVQRTARNNPKLAQAMQILEDGPHFPKWISLLQQGARVDPSDPEYKFHSQGILKTLEELKTLYTERKEQADKEEGQRKQACSDKLAALSNTLDITKKIIETLKVEISGLATTKATSRSDLVEADNTLKDDQLYLKDLTKMCEQRALEYDQRSKQRGDELTAISSALDVLGAGVKPADEAANERAALLQSAGPGLSLLQDGLARVREHRSSSALAAARNLLEADRGSQAAARAEALERRGRALELLRRESGGLGSTVLAVLATRASGRNHGGPFAKLEKLIQDLIERLVQEATEEATKKGFCDTELGKLKTDRAFRMEQVNALNAEIMGLETKKDELEMEIEELTSAINDLTLDLASATGLRSKEKADNMESIKTAKQGLAAVTQAIDILKSFYGEAAKAKAAAASAASFAEFQRRASYSPTEDDTSGAGFEGNYAGKQEAMKGIVGTLEVIQSDFDRTVRKTTEAEQNAAGEFVEYDRAAKADIAAKTTKKELDAQDLETTGAAIDSKKKDMAAEMSLVDKANQELEELKPMCVDSGMSSEERVAKREEEVVALKKALCILDAEKVEAECTRR